MTEQNLLIKICLDVVALLIVGFAWLALLLWAKPYERGYFQNDQSLSLPFKEEAISETLLAGLGFALLIITILIVEIIRNIKGKSVSDKTLCGTEIPGWVWESYVAIGLFTFGAACQQLLVTMTKYVIGRLRPHFFDLCLPSITTTTRQGYVSEFTCAGAGGAAKLKDMRLSFPSAHASFSMYCAVFFILYIQVSARWRGSKLLRHVAQFVVLLAAWYVGLSRVVDNMHHPSDVAVGFAVGAIAALITFVYLYKPKIAEPRTSWLTEPSTQPEFLPRPVLMTHNH
ncbi:putative phosphatidate phosphatase [Pieris brassicae]|uniref:Phosphatidic acid phosphatase type 2/haloperoxidase domain-containing protein n=1 Tax=Pieris brassicae TaxID=7116 RepID=A0A9P0TCJ4_PIEBR|nr:putative phosphatidate phosphatase [Pieris brassicae]CAH4029071.1 unnamed protein product [Pieris brassicae]